MDSQNISKLIVGGAGYVGSAITQLLKVYNLDITVLDNLVYEDRYLNEIPFIYGDVRDPEIYKDLNKYHTIIWLAGIVGDGACAIDPVQTRAINVDSVKKLVDTYKGKIIFPSTCSVYGMNNELLDESSPTNPLSLYAETKLEAEKYIVQNHNNYVIFRLGTLFGMGDTYSRIRLDLVANVLACRAARGEKLTVYGGQQWRPLLHVKDVATATLQAIDGLIPTGVYNLSMKNYNIADLAAKIIEICPGSEIELIDIKFEDARNYRVSSEKIKDAGWAPQYSLEDGIKEIVDTIKQNRIKNVNNAIYSNVAYLKELNKHAARI